MSFQLGCIIFITVASCVIDEAWRLRPLEKPLYGCSPVGSRVRVDMICRGCESEIIVILLMVDLWVVDMSDLDVIPDMD